MAYLGDRKDFWNVPCNPITGYRIKPLSGKGEHSQKIEENFFKDDPLAKWR